MEKLLNPSVDNAYSNTLDIADLDLKGSESISWADVVRDYPDIRQKPSNWRQGFIKIHAVGPERILDLISKATNIHVVAQNFGVPVQAIYAYFNAIPGGEQMLSAADELGAEWCYKQAMDILDSAKEEALERNMPYVAWTKEKVRLLESMAKARNRKKYGSDSNRDNESATTVIMNFSTAGTEKRVNPAYEVIENEPSN